MSKHIEMIIEYVVDGDDFQYNDNHGVLIRCKDCKHYHKDKDNIPYCYKIDYGYGFQPYDYCSRAERNGGKGYNPYKRGRQDE